MSYYNKCLLFRTPTTTPDHNSLMSNRRGGYLIPLSASEARRAHKEGRICYNISLINGDGKILADTISSKGVGIPDELKRFYIDSGINVLNVMVLCDSNNELVIVDGDLEFQKCTPDNEIKTSWDRKELDVILDNVMDLGMELRQKQLSGYGTDKSGKQILEDWKRYNL